MKKDHVLKDFFSYPMRFADFMNALFFDGHAIIHPSDLHPLDSREIFIGDFLSKERTHDVIMMWERKDFQAILILEAQSCVDFTMASRTLLYDALVYNMQDKRFKNHMLMPVMSVVLFYGEGKWYAVTSLLEKMKGEEGTVEMYSFWKDAEKSGMEKGKQQGKLSVVLIQLKKLLGKLTPDLEMKIVNSKEETLDSIIIHIFEIHNEEDVLKYIYK